MGKSFTSLFATLAFGAAMFCLDTPKAQAQHGHGMSFGGHHGGMSFGDGHHGGMSPGIGHHGGGFVTGHHHGGAFVPGHHHGNMVIGGGHHGGTIFNPAHHGTYVGVGNHGVYLGNHHQTYAGGYLGGHHHNASYALGHHHGSYGNYQPYYGHGLGIALGGINLGIGLGGFGLGGLGLGYGLYGLNSGGYGYGGYGHGGYGYGGGYASYVPFFGSAYGYGGSSPGVLFHFGSVTSAVIPSTPTQNQNQPPDNAIHLQFVVPEKAEVYFDGVKTSQTGTVREYVSPAVAPGQPYNYRITVRYTGKDGTPINDTRDIRAQANDWFTVDFTQPAPNVQPPASPKS